MLFCVYSTCMLYAIQYSEQKVIYEFSGLFLQERYLRICDLIRLNCTIYTYDEHLYGVCNKYLNNVCLEYTRCTVCRLRGRARLKMYML
jgi:hypothetical protein